MSAQHISPRSSAWTGTLLIFAGGASGLVTGFAIAFVLWRLF